MNLYNVFNNVGAGMLLTYNLLHYKKKKMLLGGASCCAIKYFALKQQHGVNKLLASLGFWVVLETLVISCCQYLVVFTSLVGNLLGTGANYFGLLFICPILVVSVCILFKIDPTAQLDLIAPAYPLALFFAKIACHFGGCCCGVQWDKGMFNPITRQIEFPAPLLEAGVALLLFIALLVFRNRFKKGTVFPVYLISFSAIRFFTEFTRCEPAVFLGLKTYHFLCILGVVFGIVEYIFICLYVKKCAMQINDRNVICRRGMQ